MLRGNLYKVAERNRPGGDTRWGNAGAQSCSTVLTRGIRGSPVSSFEQR